MALYMTIDNEYELQKIFASWNRDYYSLDGYKAILDYYNEIDSELDVISICGSFTEYNVDDLLYYYEGTDFETWLNDNGYVADWLYDNDFDDIEDVENVGMVNNMYAELKADYYDDFVAEQLDYINYNHTCVELANGNYMFME